MLIPFLPKSYERIGSREERVTKRVEIILDTGTGNALASTTTMQYDADLNVIAANHYDFAGVDMTTAQTAAISSMPIGPLVRTEETTYLVNDPAIDATTRAAYRARQLVSLTSSMRVKNAQGQIVSQSEVKYDEAAYPLLSYGGSVPGWTDPQTSIRQPDDEPRVARHKQHLDRNSCTV